MENGADPDAKLEMDNPRESGMPLMHALHLNRYGLVHLILDYNPDLNAYPYCSTPFMDCLFNQLWDDTIPYRGVAWGYQNDLGDFVHEMFARSFQNYFPETNFDEFTLPDLSKPAAILKRAIDLGGQPTLFPVVRHEHYDLIMQLLMYTPNEPGPKIDCPQVSVFENICYGASWEGMPRVLQPCKEICPHTYTSDLAKRNIERSIRSHNRDGNTAQYAQLVRAELNYLNDHGELNQVYSDGNPFLPLHWLAEDLIEPNHYGFRAPLLNEEDLIHLAQLFVAFGYQKNSMHPQTGLKVYDVALKSDLTLYAEFLSA